MASAAGFAIKQEHVPPPPPLDHELDDYERRVGLESLGVVRGQPTLPNGGACTLNRLS